MLQFTQNNKIAAAAVAIFLVSFVAMVVFVDSGVRSPDFVQSNILDSTLEKNEKGHNVYFSGEHETATTTSAHGEASGAKATSSNTTALEKSYRELANQKEAPLFVLEPDGKVKFLSKNFSEEYGYELDSVKEKNFFSFVYPVDLAEFVSSYTEVLNSGKAKNGIGPYRFIDFHSSFKVHVVSFLPVVDENGKTKEVIGYVKDITDTLKDFAMDAKAEAAETEKEESGK